MDRRRSGRGGCGRDFGIFLPRQGQNRGGRQRKAIKPCGTYRDTFPQSLREERVTAISGLVGLTGILAWKSFPNRQLRADQNLWDLQALVSVAGANFERRLRCAVSSRDAPRGSDAFPRHGFRTFLFEVHKCRESNRGARSAISD